MSKRAKNLEPICYFSIEPSKITLRFRAETEGIIEIPRLNSTVETLVNILEPNTPYGEQKFFLKLTLEGKTSTFIYQTPGNTFRKRVSLARALALGHSIVIKGEQILLRDFTVRFNTRKVAVTF